MALESNPFVSNTRNDTGSDLWRSTIFDRMNQQQGRHSLRVSTAADYKPRDWKPRSYHEYADAGIGNKPGTFRFASTPPDSPRSDRPHPADPKKSSKSSKNSKNRDKQLSDAIRQTQKSLKSGDPSRWSFKSKEKYESGSRRNQKNEADEVAPGTHGYRAGDPRLTGYHGYKDTLDRDQMTKHSKVKEKSKSKSSKTSDHKKEQKSKPEEKSKSSKQTKAPYESSKTSSKITNAPEKAKGTNTGQASESQKPKENRKDRDSERQHVSRRDADERQRYAESHSSSKLSQKLKKTGQESGSKPALPTPSFSKNIPYRPVTISPERPPRQSKGERASESKSKETVSTDRRPGKQQYYPEVTKSNYKPYRPVTIDPVSTSHGQAKKSKETANNQTEGSPESENPARSKNDYGSSKHVKHKNHPGHQDLSESYERDMKSKRGAGGGKPAAKTTPDGYLRNSPSHESIESYKPKLPSHQQEVSGSEKGVNNNNLNSLRPIDSDPLTAPDGSPKSTESSQSISLGSSLNRRVASPDDLDHKKHGGGGGGLCSCFSWVDARIKNHLGKPVPGAGGGVNGGYDNGKSGKYPVINYEDESGPTTPLQASSEMPNPEKAQKPFGEQPGDAHKPVTNRFSKAKNKNTKGDRIAEKKTPKQSRPKSEEPLQQRKREDTPEKENGVQKRDKYDTEGRARRHEKSSSTPPAVDRKFIEDLEERLEPQQPEKPVAVVKQRPQTKKTPYLEGILGLSGGGDGKDERQPSTTQPAPERQQNTGETSSNQIGDSSSNSSFKQTNSSSPPGSLSTPAAMGRQQKARSPSLSPPDHEAMARTEEKVHVLRNRREKQRQTSRSPMTNLGNRVKNSLRGRDPHVESPFWKSEHVPLEPESAIWRGVPEAETVYSPPSGIDPRRLLIHSQAGDQPLNDPCFEMPQSTEPVENLYSKSEYILGEKVIPRQIDTGSPSLLKRMRSSSRESRDKIKGPRDSPGKISEHPRSTSSNTDTADSASIGRTSVGSFKDKLIGAFGGKENMESPFWLPDNIPATCHTQTAGGCQEIIGYDAALSASKAKPGKPALEVQTMPIVDPCDKTKDEIGGHSEENPATPANSPTGGRKAKGSKFSPSKDPSSSSIETDSAKTKLASLKERITGSIHHTIIGSQNKKENMESPFWDPEIQPPQAQDMPAGGCQVITPYDAELAARNPQITAKSNTGTSRNEIPEMAKYDPCDPEVTWNESATPARSILKKPRTSSGSGSGSGSGITEDQSSTVSSTTPSATPSADGTRHHHYHDRHVHHGTLNDDESRKQKELRNIAGHAFSQKESTIGFGSQDNAKRDLNHGDSIGYGSEHLKKHRGPDGDTSKGGAGKDQHENHAFREYTIPPTKPPRTFATTFGDISPIIEEGSSLASTPASATPEDEASASRDPQRHESGANAYAVVGTPSDGGRSDYASRYYPGAHGRKPEQPSTTGQHARGTANSNAGTKSPDNQALHDVMGETNDQAPYTVNEPYEPEKSVRANDLSEDYRVEEPASGRSYSIDVGALPLSHRLSQTALGRGTADDAINFGRYEQGTNRETTNRLTGQRDQRADTASPVDVSLIEFESNERMINDGMTENQAEGVDTVREREEEKYELVDKTNSQDPRTPSPKHQQRDPITDWTTADRYSRFQRGNHSNLYASPERDQSKPLDRVTSTEQSVESGQNAGTRSKSIDGSETSSAEEQEFYEEWTEVRTVPVIYEVSDANSMTPTKETFQSSVQTEQANWQGSSSYTVHRSQTNEVMSTPPRSLNLIQEPPHTRQNGDRTPSPGHLMKLKIFDKSTGDSPDPKITPIRTQFEDSSSPNDPAGSTRTSTDNDRFPSYFEGRISTGGGNRQEDSHTIGHRQDRTGYKATATPHINRPGLQYQARGGAGGLKNPTPMPGTPPVSVMADRGDTEERRIFFRDSGLHPVHEDHHQNQLQNDHFKQNLITGRETRTNPTSGPGQEYKWHEVYTHSTTSSTIITSGDGRDENAPVVVSFNKATSARQGAQPYNGGGAKAGSRHARSAHDIRGSRLIDYAERETRFGGSGGESGFESEGIGGSGIRGSGGARGLYDYSSSEEDPGDHLPYDHLNGQMSQGSQTRRKSQP